MDGNSEEAPKKSAKQLEKEAKKSAKLEKFKQKQEQKSSRTEGATVEVSTGDHAREYKYLHLHERSSIRLYFLEKRKKERN